MTGATPTLAPSWSEHDTSGKRVDLIAKSYATYLIAECAYYQDALFPALRHSVVPGSELSESALPLRQRLTRARSAYFEALTAA